jgi:hypothetical protein
VLTLAHDFFMPESSLPELSVPLCIPMKMELISHHFGGHHTMILESESQTYDTGDEHESSLRYSGLLRRLLNSGFNSRSQPFSSYLSTDSEEDPKNETH